MRGMRISAALCSAALAVGLMAGCGGADGSNDRGERTVTVVPSPSASKPTDAGWHAVNSKQLPPASAALEMAEDEQGREFEQRAIDAGTPDPCALISMFRYGKIMQQDAYILGNGSPYDPDSRRNCYITRGPQKNSGGKIENSAFTADRIDVAGMIPVKARSSDRDLVSKRHVDHRITEPAGSTVLCEFHPGLTT